MAGGGWWPYPWKSRLTVSAWFITRISSEEDPCRPKGTKFHSNWPKARLPPVRGPHLELMIATREIELGNEARAAGAVEQRVDVRERLDRRRVMALRTL